MHYARRSGIDPREFLERLCGYLDEDFGNAPLHPKHRTENEKEILKLRRKMRRLRTSRRRQWYMDRIRELKNAQGSE